MEDEVTNLKSQQMINSNAAGQYSTNAKDAKSVKSTLESEIQQLSHNFRIIFTFIVYVNIFLLLFNDNNDITIIATMTTTITTKIIPIIAESGILFPFLGVGPSFNDPSFK